MIEAINFKFGVNVD